MSSQTSPSNSARSFLAWVWAGLLIAGGAAFVASTTGLIPSGGPLLPAVAAALGALAVPFCARWLARRGDWWAALTAWVFVAIALLLVAIGLRLPDPLVGAAALLLVAIPFAAVYLFNRACWWALAPAYALLVLAILLALTLAAIPLPTLGAFGLLGAALPFWVVYMLDRLQWWALIPAGALSVGGVALLAVFAFTQPGGSSSFYVILNAALAAVALALWLTVRRFDWAAWIAAGFALAALLSIWFPSSANWALVALVLGFYIAFKQIDAAQKQRAAAASPVPPAPAPAAAPPPPAAQPAPPPAAPPAPSGPSGLLADREASAASEARRAGEGGVPPVEFRPLDPFKTRREGSDGEARKDDSR